MPTGRPCSHPSSPSWCDGSGPDRVVLGAVGRRRAGRDGRGTAGRTVPCEPLYGDTYLPRKFKIGIAWPGDNCIDVYSHDVGIVPDAERGSHRRADRLRRARRRRDGDEPLPARRHLPGARPHRSPGCRRRTSPTSSRRSSPRSATSAIATTAIGPGSSTRSRSAASSGSAPRSRRVPAGPLAEPVELPPWNDRRSSRLGRAGPTVDTLGLPGAVRPRRRQLPRRAPRGRCSRGWCRRSGSRPARISCSCGVTRPRRAARHAAPGTASRCPTTSARCAGWRSPARRCRRAGRRSARPSGSCRR